MMRKTSRLAGVICVFALLSCARAPQDLTQSLSPLEIPLSYVYDIGRGFHYPSPQAPLFGFNPMSQSPWQYGEYEQTVFSQVPPRSQFVPYADPQNIPLGNAELLSWSHREHTSGKIQYLFAETNLREEFNQASTNGEESYNLGQVHLKSISSRNATTLRWQAPAAGRAMIRVTFEDRRKADVEILSYFAVLFKGRLMEQGNLKEFEMQRSVALEFTVQPGDSIDFAVSSHAEPGAVVGVRGYIELFVAP